jgi:hypothetical protein
MTAVITIGGPLISIGTHSVQVMSSEWEDQTEVNIRERAGGRKQKHSRNVLA